MTESAKVDNNRLDDNFAKSAGEIVSSALARDGEAQTERAPAKKNRAKNQPVNWELIKRAMKLAELAEKWHSVAGEPLASKSVPAAFEEADDRLLVTVNVASQMVLSSARFRKMRLERAISDFFGISPISVEFKVGALSRPRATTYSNTTAHAPVVNSAAEIAEREEFFKESEMSEELASSMARVMLSLEKISKRRGGSERN